MSHEAFRTAVEAGDLDGMVDALADDVVFHSPITFKPFEGRESVGDAAGRGFSHFRGLSLHGRARR